MTTAQVPKNVTENYKDYNGNGQVLICSIINISIHDDGEDTEGDKLKSISTMTLAFKDDWILICTQKTDWLCHHVTSQ